MSKEDGNRQSARQHLLAFATGWLAEWCGQDPGDRRRASYAAARDWLRPYHALLARSPEWKPPPPGAPLLSIFSRIKHPKRPDPKPLYWPAVPLSLDEPAYPAAQVQHAPRLWELFLQEESRLEALDEGARFDPTVHLLHKYAWGVPCSHGEPGVSLYDEFRALSALVHASECAPAPAQEGFLLVGGDIPGIQEFVYTITSKGAAKGLRGRSLFLQFLGDAVVRRLLADLALPETNVVYAAGGNFVLLVQAGGAVQEAIARARARVNACLVEALQGETCLVLEAWPLALAGLQASGGFWNAREALGQAVAVAKSRPLREQAEAPAPLFEPKGKGSRLSCAVCRVEVDERDSKPLTHSGEGPAGGEPPRICYRCDGFRQLAEELRPRRLWIGVEDATGELGSPVQPKDGWSQLLARMTGFRYHLAGSPPPIPGALVLAVNQPDFIQAGARGFRVLATATPRTTPEDVDYLRNKAGWAEEDLPEPGDVRSFWLMAHDAAAAGALERVGVLRMDVDGLGWVFSQGMPDLTLPALGALSRSIDTFFGGQVDRLVRRYGQEDGQGGLYIIYAGGDDLFVVGAWHRLPELAEAIRDRFGALVGGNQAFGLSGGITLEDASFPLYRAAERAGEAEGLAKGHRRPDERNKDALCFLGTVVPWEDWPLVRSQKDELLWLIGALDNPGDERRLPRGLLQTVQTLYELYRTGLRDARRRARERSRQRGEEYKPDPHDERLFYGRWTWMRVYSLTRLAQRSKKDVPDAPERIQGLQRQIMQPTTMRYSGLAARWAEYLTRPPKDGG